MRDWLYAMWIGGQRTLPVSTILMNFLVACVLAALIFLTYRIAHHGTLYSRKFNVTLIMLTVVTALVMNVIGNNVALSLGMVGALSIVRFRTAVKDARDAAYIFWAIAVGICCGVSDYLVACIGSVLLFLLLTLFGVLKDDDRMLIILHTSADVSGEAEEATVRWLLGKAKLRVRNLSAETDDAELIFEASGSAVRRAEDQNGALKEALANLSGIRRINFVAQEDDINQ